MFDAIAPVLRMVLVLVAATVLLYSVGWGPLLGAGFVAVVVVHIRMFGARMWRPGLVWSVACIAAGQVAVALGWAYSYLSPAQSQVAGVLNAFAAVTLIGLIGVTSEQREAAEAAVRAGEERFHALLTDSGDLIALVGSDGRVGYVSPAVATLIGVRPEDVVGTPFEAWVAAEDRATAHALIYAALAGPGGEHRVEMRMRHTDGGVRRIEATVRNLTANPAVGGLIAYCRDVTELRTVVDRLNHDADHDPLTGLLNRAAFLRELDLAFGSGPTAVLYVDLDGLRGINDLLGHDAGDASIIAAAGMLRRSALGSDVVGRLGGGEFGVVLPGADNLDRAVTVAERLLLEMDRPVQVEGHPLRLRASVGIAVRDGFCPDAREMLSRARAAMYRAKRGGTHSYEVHLTGEPARR